LIEVIVLVKLKQKLLQSTKTALHSFTKLTSRTGINFWLCVDILMQLLNIAIQVLQYLLYNF